MNKILSLTLIIVALLNPQLHAMASAVNVSDNTVTTSTTGSTLTTIPSATKVFVKAFDDVVTLTANLQSTSTTTSTSTNSAPFVVVNAIANDENAGKTILSPSTPPKGRYGYLNGDTNLTQGTYTYTLDPTNPAVNALKSGESLTETFDYIAVSSIDSSKTAIGHITIHILGSTILSIAPIANDDATTLGINSAVERPAIKLNVLSNDLNADKATLTGNSVGQYGYIDGGLSVDGTLTYQVNKDNATLQKLITAAGGQIVDTFTYIANAKSPNDRNTATGKIRIIITTGNITTIKAFDYVASIIADDSISTSTLTTTTTVTRPTVTGNLKDYNEGLSNLKETPLRTEITSSLVGAYGSLQFSSATNIFTYTLNNGVAQLPEIRNAKTPPQEIFSYQITDQYGGAAAANIIINILSNRDQSLTTNVEVETNDRSSFATPLNNGIYIKGNLKDSNDRDWYVINSSGGEVLHFELCPPGFACNNQKGWVMYVFDGDKLTQAMEETTIPLSLIRDDTGAILQATNYNHFYLLYQFGIFNDALLGVINPCYGSTTAVNIGTPTLAPGTNRNYFVAISSPLQTDGGSASSASTTSTCSAGSVVLEEAGPSFDETTTPSTTSTTVGNTTSTTTSTTKKVTTTRQFIAIYPNTDDEYTINVTRTGVSPSAATTDTASFSASTGNVQIPKIRVKDQLFSVQLQQTATAKNATSTPSFSIMNAQPLTESLSADATLSTFNPANNIVKLPKVRDEASGQAFSVDLRYVQPTNSLQFLSATPLK